MGKCAQGDEEHDTMYQKVENRSSGDVPLYAATEAAADDANIDSLKELVGGPAMKLGGQGISGESAVPMDPGPDAPEAEKQAYYDALAAQARGGQKDISADDMANVAKPLSSSGANPSEDDRKALLAKAMAGSKSAGTEDSASTGGGGTSASGPSDEQRRKLMEQAMAGAKKTAPAAAPPRAKGANEPSDEQRRKLMEQAQAHSSSATSAPKASKPRPGGPSDEQRRKLMEQAMAGSAKSATQTRKGPTPEERAKLLEAAKSGARRGGGGKKAPTAEERAALMQQAMGGR